MSYPDILYYTKDYRLHRKPNGYFCDFSNSCLRDVNLSIFVRGGSRGKASSLTRYELTCVVFYDLDLSLQLNYDHCTISINFSHNINFLIYIL